MAWSHQPDHLVDNLVVNVPYSPLGRCHMLDAVTGLGHVGTLVC